MIDALKAKLFHNVLYNTWKWYGYPSTQVVSPPGDNMVGLPRSISLRRGSVSTCDVDKDKSRKSNETTSLNNISQEGLIGLPFTEYHARLQDAKHT